VEYGNDLELEQLKINIGDNNLFVKYIYL